MGILLMVVFLEIWKEKKKERKNIGFIEKKKILIKRKKKKRKEKERVKEA